MPLKKKHRRTVRTQVCTLLTHNAQKKNSESTHTVEYTHNVYDVLCSLAYARAYCVDANFTYACLNVRTYLRAHLLMHERVYTLRIVRTQKYACVRAVCVRTIRTYLGMRSTYSVRTHMYARKYTCLRMRK